MSDGPAYAVLALLVAIVLGCTYGVVSYTCEKHWERSGMTASFSVFAGCQLRLPDGRWIPEKAYREIP